MATAEAAMPRVLLISLNFRPIFDNMYDPLLAKIRSKATIQRAKKATSAIRLVLEEPRPVAVLITDEAITTTQNSAVWDTVLGYVRQGGTSVVMGHFPGFVTPNYVGPFFAKARLQWRSGSYYRSAFALNQFVPDQDLVAQLPHQYSQKAVLVRDVTPSEAWYLTVDISIIQAQAFGPNSDQVVRETPVAFAHIGEGKLGYVGDVNAEEGSNTVILVMCGLS
ncbi:hypothetical protein F4677DRAFT_401966 [Hypoxylon crocopeplum]|nr:hypothetical protein F4677DRAFT_401966 [Hypoxylon crocopeplum]